MPAGIWERLPGKSEILNLFAGMVFIVYTWTVWQSFQKVPSWLFYLKPVEIASVYSYSFLVNFIECILLLGIAIIPSVIFPQTWWRDAFVVKGLVLAAVLVGSMQIHLSKYPGHELRDSFLDSQLLWWLNTLWIAAILAWLAARFGWLKRSLESFADQLSIFLYIYIPLTIMGLIVVLARVLW